MSDWEDFCEHYGVPNNGDDEWLIKMIDRGNKEEERRENKLKQPNIDKPKLSDGMYFDNYKEAHEFAKNTAINNKICVTVISKDKGYFVKLSNN